MNEEQTIVELIHTHQILIQQCQERIYVLEKLLGIT
jgi:hypothetical protein